MEISQQKPRAKRKRKEKGEEGEKLESTRVKLQVTK